MQAKSGIIFWICLAFLFVMLTAATAMADLEIENIEVSNITSSSATISWTTTTSEDGCIHYGLTTSLGDSTCDSRSDDFVHYAILTGLNDDTTYYYEVLSGTLVDDNGGSKYSFHTAVVDSGTSFTIYGKVFSYYDSSAWKDVIVTAELETGITLLLSDLTDTTGRWTMNLGDLKDDSTYEAYDYSSGDVINVYALRPDDNSSNASDTIASSPQIIDTLYIGCNYLCGDINGSSTVNGLDVVYGSTYFNSGGPEPPYECECTSGSVWFVSSDVNNSCTFNGLDVTYLYYYLHGGPAPVPCDDCPPMQ